MLRRVPLTSQFLMPCLVMAVVVPVILAGEVYYTGFETPPFTVGDDCIIGTDLWVGSSAHAGLKLDGIMSETQHGLAGIGNAAFIGGYATTTATTTNRNVYVRRPVNIDPIALNQEVVTFSMAFGIKDSTTSKRDNFEVLIYNSQLALLAGIQFDNTTLDTSVTPNIPRRLIYQLTWNTATAKYVYTPTGYNFLAETPETLQIRINFRTNRWTVKLSDVPIIQDSTFYTGSATKTFGSVMVNMAVGNVAPTTGYILPGDNYMIFDDYTVRTDAPDPSPVISKSGAGAATISWNEEAGYNYQVLYAGDCSTWKSDLAGSSHKASVTGSVSFTDPTPVLPAQRCYRVYSWYP